MSYKEDYISDALNGSISEVMLHLEKLEQLQNTALRLLPPAKFLFDCQVEY